jgi:hypothetical protein
MLKTSFFLDIVYKQDHFFVWDIKHREQNEKKEINEQYDCMFDSEINKKKEKKTREKRNIKTKMDNIVFLLIRSTRKRK